MKVVITGGSGFIGTRLGEALLQKGHTIVVLDLVEPKVEEAQFARIDLARERPSREILRGTDAVFHLAGRPIGVRWSRQVKREIRDSRVVTARQVIDGLRALEQKPRVFISASAVGIYGDRKEEELDEQAAPGNDFLAGLCAEWEAAGRMAEELGMRSVQVRTAPVLQSTLDKMIPLYQWGLGGPLGNGKQWFPWIHIADLVAVYLFALEHEEMQGPVNAAAPELARQKEFAKQLGRQLGRPAILPTPKFALKLRFGELADALLASQKVQPVKLKEAGFRFRFPVLAEALGAAISDEKQKQ